MDTKTSSSQLWRRHIYSHSVFALVHRPAFQLSWCLPSCVLQDEKSLNHLLTVITLLDFRLPPKCKWCLHFSKMSCSVDWLVTYRRFGTACSSHLQGSWDWRWGWQAVPKRRHLTINKSCVTSQKTEDLLYFFIIGLSLHLGLCLVSTCPCTYIPSYRPRHKTNSSVSTAVIGAVGCPEERGLQTSAHNSSSRLFSDKSKCRAVTRTRETGGRQWALRSVKEKNLIKMLIAGCLHIRFFAVVKLVALRLYRFAAGCGS